MTRSTAVKVLVGVSGAVVALFMLSRPSNPSATTTNPAATSKTYFSLLPSSSQLPSESTCATEVASDTFEPRPENAQPNSTKPGASYLAAYRSKIAGGEGGSPGSYLQRVDGQFTGSTDAILKWAACKWGFDENVTRATAVNETHWRQLEIGDVGNGTSLGILQVKSTDYPSTCPAVASSQNAADVTDPGCLSYLSTAFNADYKLAQQRACFEGKVSYLSEEGAPPAGYPNYPNGTPDEMMWGCIGWWYSGHWFDAAALKYIAEVQSYLADQAWMHLSSGQ